MSEPRQPGGEAPEAERPKPGARYPIYVGIAFVILVAYATVNTIQTDDDGVLGVSGIEEGRALAEFAVPDVRSDLEGDANVFQDDCESSRNPCPEPRKPACQVKEPGAIQVCDLFDKPLAISFWFTGGASCLAEQDAFDRVAERYDGRVNFLSLNVRDEIADVRSIVADRGWTVPVGWDRDGAVSNVYRVGLCPTLALAYPGGILKQAQIGTEAFTEDALASSLDELIDASRRRAEVSR
jgi:thiol-disulfide isomerase/thioredoxin